MIAGRRGRLAELERENAKLRKIRDVLVRRVERSMDLQGSEFALFERATLLEAEVRKRTPRSSRPWPSSKRTNRAVEEARAAADAANLSKTRFLAAASHDLLQPLNAARLFLSALAETELPENAERLVENVELAFEFDRPAAQCASRHLQARCRRRHTGNRERAARPAAAPAGR